MESEEKAYAFWVKVNFIGGIQKKITGNDADLFITSLSKWDSRNSNDIIYFPQEIHPNDERYEEDCDNYTTVGINMRNVLWVEFQ